MTYTAVIFDLDGTLLDTEHQMAVAAQRAFDHLNVAMPTGFMEALVGVDFNSGVTLIQRRWPHLDLTKLNKAWNHETKQMQAQGIPLKPGVEQVLDRVDQLGLPKAVATSSFAHSAQLKLEASGLATRFDTVITVDCVDRPKPAADPYLLAAERLCVRPATCLAFEDSETGSQSAFDAGMTVVLVPDIAPTTGRFAHFQGKDLVLGASLAGLF